MGNGPWTTYPRQAKRMMGLGGRLRSAVFGPEVIYDRLVMIPQTARWMALAGLAFVSASFHAGDPPAPLSPDVPAPNTVRGMTISCHGSGRSWGTDAMVETMSDLKSIGVTWIAIHPYAGIRADGTVRFAPDSGMYADPTWLTRPIREAHDLGLKIMIKPHLAYWGSPFEWRGAITFKTDEQWDRFFDTYESWITHVAELAADADCFVVGTELDRTLNDPARWRRIIAAVRAVNAGPLTYAANWDAYQRVPFWDDLDSIGIQAYFPLADKPGLIDEDALDRAWSNHLNSLERFSRKHDRPILFTELGYDSSPLAAQQPWAVATTGDADDLELQSRCMSAAIRAINSSDAVAGVFLWKWFPEPFRARIAPQPDAPVAPPEPEQRYGHGHGGGSFLLSASEMRRIIATHWVEVVEVEIVEP